MGRKSWQRAEEGFCEEGRKEEGRKEGREGGREEAWVGKCPLLILSV